MFDVAKAFAMFMVVFGHVAGAAHMFGGRVYNFGIGFKMPIFFFISGYFLWTTIQRGDCRKLLTHLRSYFLPLAWISVGYAVISLLLGTIEKDAGSAVKWAFGFFCGQWFVWALAGTYVLIFCVCQIVRSNRLKFIVSAMACVVALCLPFPYAREMVPYFVCGMIVRHLSVRPWESLRVGLSCAIVYMAVILLEGNVHTNDMGFYYTDTSIAALASIRGGAMWVARHFLGVVGSIAVLTACYLVLRYVPRVGILAGFGTTTLGVYLLHQQMIKMFQKLPCLLSTSWGVIAVTIILFFSCHLIVIVSRDHIRWTRKVIWGFR